MDEIVPRERAEIYRKFDLELLPLLRDVVSGSANPESRAYTYNAEKWELVMDWLERRATIDLLRGLKAGEPPLDDPRHESWQEHYDKFKERVLGFVKLKAAGAVTDPETVYFVVMLFQKLNDFSSRALSFLEVKERPHLGEAERPLETEVVLGDPDS